jgi:Putative metal-binding motif
MYRLFASAVLAATLFLVSCAGEQPEPEPGPVPTPPPDTKTETDTGVTPSANDGGPGGSEGASSSASDGGSDASDSAPPVTPPSCASAGGSPCDDNDPCNGLEACDPNRTGADAHGCVRATPAVTCPSGQTCEAKTGACSACSVTPDVDGDGHASTTCGGQDCDDNDASRHPGVPEVCDGKDNDCSGKVDDADAAASCNAPVAADATCTLGSCSIKCKDPQHVWKDGSCQPSCGLMCGGQCVTDNLTNNQHCGFCGNTCPDGSRCSSGMCLPTCQLETGPKWYLPTQETCRLCDGKNTLLPVGGECPSPLTLVWPNADSSANSSQWLRDNHHRIKEMRPRVLVLDVVQGAGLAPVEEFVPRFVAAVEAQTRYLGYANPASPPFLRYQIDKILDLKDPGGAEYPATWPVVNGDIGPLFTQEYAEVLGYRDPNDPTRFMPMCELFERGFLNELWIAAGSGRNLYENQSHVQVYDENLQPIPGSFNNCTNACFNDPGQLVTCKVTVRMQEINKGRGPGCATHAAGHALENMRAWIPYMHEADRFFGFDLDTRFGLPRSSLYHCPYKDYSMCVSHPAANVLQSGVDYPEGAQFKVDNWGAGCGNTHFPPNATGQYAYYESMPALSSCEGYGLGGGATGGDRTTEYTSAKVEAYESMHGDCGGGWMVYLGQSVPGLANQALDSKGTPMRNWWPFLFY